MNLAFKFLSKSARILFLILSLSLTSCNSTQENNKPQEEHKTHYECPPCGCASDGKISETGGVCPSCGIALVEKKTTNSSNEVFFKPLKVSDETLNVAIFLFHKNQVLDYAGPYDAFSPHYQWKTPRYLAIDQGTIGPMMENHQTQLFWSLFMNAPEIRQGLINLGFSSTQHGF